MLIVFGFVGRVGISQEVPVNLPPTEVVELFLTPCRISNPPATWNVSEQGPPSQEAALLQRKWLIEAWEVIKTRNDDAVFNKMLREMPESNQKDRLVWIDYMSEKYMKPIEGVLAASRLGASYPISVSLDDDGDWNRIPYNGALVLQEPLVSWVIREACLDPDSILENFPWVMRVIGDWSRTADSFDRDFGADLEPLFLLKDMPNLGPALRGFPTPLRERKSFFRDYRQDFFKLMLSSETLRRLDDPNIADKELLDECTSALARAFRKELDQGNYVAESEEDWFAKIEASRENSLMILRETGKDMGRYDKMDTRRLIWLAAMREYDHFCDWHERLFAMPVHEAIDYWKKTRMGGYSFQSRPIRDRAIPVSMLPISSRPIIHWNNEQGIAAISVLFYLRDHIATEKSFPHSLDEIDGIPFDPISGKPFVYRRIAEDQAELDLAHCESGVRKTYRLRLP